MDKAKDIEPPIEEDPEMLKQIQELQEHAQRAMENADFRTQNYWMRLDRKSVIKTEKELEHCMKLGIRTKIISYQCAVQTLDEEKAQFKQQRKVKKAKKVARQSRKRNR